MASVFLGDLNDYIEPSQACINPIFTLKNKSQENNNNLNTNKKDKTTRIVLENDIFNDFNSNLIRSIPSTNNNINNNSNNNKTKATITLNDCLACSGCVTSTETVLISEQSTKEFLNNITNNIKYKKIIISISPQSITSIAVYFNINNIKDTFYKLRYFLKYHIKNSSIHAVIDTTTGTNIALIETTKEFINRYKNTNKNRNNTNEYIWKEPKYSVPISSTETFDIESNKIINNSINIKENNDLLPLITSACPGWICYAEKSKPNTIPHINTVKSPQQIMGSIIKYVLFTNHISKINDDNNVENGNDNEEINPNKIYHATIMPCYDKKLEASRKNFYDAIYKTNDVDLVLSTNDLLELICSYEEEDSHFKFKDIIPDNCMKDNKIETYFYSFTGGKSAELYGSGGYIDYVLRYSAKELFSIDINDDNETGYTIKRRKGKNNDYEEFYIENENNEKLLVFIKAYGFRNIQTVITKLQKNTRQKNNDKNGMHFIEMMACPSGCLNGGGQIKQENKSMDDTLESNITNHETRLQKVSNLFSNIDSSDDNTKIIIKQSNCQNLLDYLCNTNDENLLKLLHTRYHAIPKLELSNPLGIKW